MYSIVFCTEFNVFYDHIPFCTVGIVHVLYCIVCNIFVIVVYFALYFYCIVCILCVAYIVFLLYFVLHNIVCIVYVIFYGMKFIVL